MLLGGRVEAVAGFGASVGEEAEMFPVVLSLVAGVETANPGFGWSQGEALKLYGLFTGFVYFTPLLGGWLADNYLGQRKCVIIGGLVMAAGQFTLASSIPGNLGLFYVGLVLLVIGNGFFKPNISTMVGDLYPEGDARRDGAFTIFYMGINSGALIAPFVCSTLGEDPAYGWRFGYMAAGIGMLLSVVIQLALSNRYLADIGKLPAAHGRWRGLAASMSRSRPTRSTACASSSCCSCSWCCSGPRSSRPAV